MPSSKSSLDKRDVYYRKGKSDGYRARSAYKLLHLDEEFDLFRGVETAVDLCAAPGSWTQVLSQRLKPGEGSRKVVSVDLQPIAPLPGVSILEADITQPQTVPRVLEALDGRKADLVICDGAPDVTGVHDLDAYLHSQLLLAATTLALTLMAPHATLVFKIFLSPLDPTAALLRSQLRTFFPGPSPGDSDEFSDSPSAFDNNGAVNGNGHAREPSASASSAAQGHDSYGRSGGVWVRKPRSSRQGSGEAFIVCRNFDPSTLPLPTEFTEQSLTALRDQVGGTLTLESLGALGSQPSSTPDSNWSNAKGFVSGGDLNGGLHAPTPRQALSVDVTDFHRRQSLTSIDGGPSPVESHFPTTVTRASSVRSPKVSDSKRRHRAVSEAFAPVPLPSPLPGRIGEHSAREFQDLAVSPDRFFTSSAFGTPNFGSPRPSSPSGLTANEREIMAATPQTAGAVSPALSSSSKTDSFFSSSPLASLPVPPKPLGRVPSLGRGVPPLFRNRNVTTPAGPLEPLSTSPTSSTLIVPTPLRSVTGPGPIALPSTPPPVPTETFLSPPSRRRSQNREPHHITREVHHAEPAEDAIQAGDTLVPVADDKSLPISSSENPGQWALLRPLGKGAFASVWSAKSEQDGEVAAVKMVDRVACVRNSRTASAFYREVEVLRHLVHQGIVGYIAHFSTEHHHCLVLEQLNGGECFSLVEIEANRDRMLRPAPDDPEGHGLIRRIFGELCRAVSWLHEVEVVHRDIKLENILFTVNPFSLPPTAGGSVPLESLPTPLVKLTDFGLSRFIRADAPLLSTRCGSEAYAAPEVVMGSLYDGRRTDAWALGIVLYALAAGELPFDEGAPPPPGRPRASSTASTTSTSGDSHRRTMHRIAKGAYGWREGAATQPLMDVVARLLTRDPQRRARVHQLWDEEWMTGYGGVPPPSQPMKPTAGMVQDMSRRQSQTPSMVVQDGLLVDPGRIDDVARVEQ